MGIPYAPTSVYSSCMSYTQRSKAAAWLKHSVEMRWIHTVIEKNLSEEVDESWGEGMTAWGWWWWWWWWWWYGGAMYDQPLRTHDWPDQGGIYTPNPTPLPSKKIDSSTVWPPRTPPPQTVQESILLEISSPNTAKEEETPAGTAQLSWLGIQSLQLKSDASKISNLSGDVTNSTVTCIHPQTEKFKSCAVDYSYLSSI